jgi:hypothetical protein
MTNKTTKLMPLARHRRSQKAGVEYTLGDAVPTVVDALMTTSGLTGPRSEDPSPTSDQRSD